MWAKRIDPTLAQQAIVLQVLRDDHAKQWTRTELEQEVSDIEPLTISDALMTLETEGVVILGGEHVEASRLMSILTLARGLKVPPGELLDTLPGTEDWHDIDPQEGGEE